MYPRVEAEEVPRKTNASSAVRFHELDGLRALAVTLVVIHHFAPSNLYAPLEGTVFEALGVGLSLTTNSGVELFFVLSGVVLLRPYLRGERRFVSARYVLRRIERLWPPYLASLIFSALVVLIATIHSTWYSEQILPQFELKDVLAQAGIVNFGWHPYNLAWWSLTPEVIFYAVAPITVAIFSRRWFTPSRLVLAIGTSIMLSILLWNDQTSMPGIQNGWSSVGRQFLAYLPCFLAGTLVAKFDFTTRQAAIIAGLGLLYLIVTVARSQLNPHAAYALIYLGLVLLVMGKKNWLSRILSTRFAVWIGERSYSLFLLHFAALYLANYIASLVFDARVMGYFLLSRVLGLVVASLATILVFTFIERRYARGLVTGHIVWPWQLGTAGATVRAADESTANAQSADTRRGQRVASAYQEVSGKQRKSPRA